MIIYLSGTLVSSKPTNAVVDVGGIGYEVHIPTSTYERLPNAGEPVLLYTHHYIREDAEQLYGFAGTAERTVFRIMLAVSGIGPKLALAALSAFDPSELQDYVTRGDVSVLTSIPGVGRKTAERLIVELRDRFGHADLAGTSGDGATAAGTMRSDAIAALEALGLSRSAAEKSISKSLKDRPGTDSVEQLIRDALKGG